METSKIYSMVYDSPKYGNNGLGEYLGEFKRIKQLREDGWVDDFIGVNVETNEVCIILSREMCGYGGGMASEVIPIPELMVKDMSIYESLSKSMKEAIEFENGDISKARVIVIHNEETIDNSSSIRIKTFKNLVNSLPDDGEIRIEISKNYEYGIRKSLENIDSISKSGKVFIIRCSVDI